MRYVIVVLVLALLVGCSQHAVAQEAAPVMDSHILLPFVVGGSLDSVTPTPTPTPTGEITPTTTPPPVVWPTGITNGGFETGPPAHPWLYEGELVYKSEEYSRSGEWHVMMAQREAVIAQKTTVPTGKDLGYWFGVWTSDLWDAHDFLTCVVWDKEGIPIGTCGQWSNLYDSDYWWQVRITGWDEISLRKVYVGFVSSSEDANNTIFFLDDVSWIRPTSGALLNDNQEVLTIDLVMGDILIDGVDKLKGDR
ncbi:hypothetical protein LCGC14_1132990 [marine sediment metagenome]|uniref:Uncharacterized protein n=1 Tax=marine sediment metagenome TaxID=412755 RepID=A0A0F9PIU3_9ZZZZ